MYHFMYNHVFKAFNGFFRKLSVEPDCISCWADPADPVEWVTDTAKIPSIDRTLVVSRQNESVRWINLDTYLNWESETPADQKKWDVERREVSLWAKAYLLPADKAEHFMEWALSVSFWNNWMPEGDETYMMFIGEYPWAVSLPRHHSGGHHMDGWVRPEYDCLSVVMPATFRYVCEAAGFDCSVDEGFSLRLPAPRKLFRSWACHGVEKMPRLLTIRETLLHLIQRLRNLVHQRVSFAKTFLYAALRKAA